jgi:hypothetical protein
MARLSHPLFTSMLVCSVALQQGYAHRAAASQAAPSDVAWAESTVPGAVGAHLQAPTSTWSVHCFAADQRLLFGDTWMTVAQAMQARVPSVTVLAANAHATHPTFVQVPIVEFYSQPFTGSMVRIETWDGDVLRVTGSHRVLAADGHFVAAEQVQPEMALWGMHGPTRVMATHQSPYTGVVWHVRAAGGEAGEQALVAEGLLTGTLAFQSAAPNGATDDQR